MHNNNQSKNQLNQNINNVANKMTTAVAAGGRHVVGAVSAGILTAAMLGSATFADASTTLTSSRFRASGGNRPIVFGTVAEVNGSQLTITTKSGRRRRNGDIDMATYTVDAKDASVFKTGETSTVSSIEAGDKILVQGVIKLLENLNEDGATATVTATVIRDLGTGLSMISK